MNLREVKKLAPNDEIFWEDPDHGLCSRHILIQSIEVRRDVVCIIDFDGDYLECFAHELS